MSNVLLMWVVSAGVGHAALPDGRVVMQKNEESRRLRDVVATATLTTGGGESGTPTKVKKFTWWRKLISDQIHYNTLTRFHQPAEVKGEGILFLEHPDGENDVLMYLPNFKKIRRVETQNQAGSFMSSEFSYSDIATPHVDDYAYKTLREEACPVGGGKCVVVESVPANEAVRDRTGASKTLSWIRGDNFMFAQVEYWDLDGAAWKRLTAPKIEEVDKTGHKWMALDLRMENLKNKKATTLEFEGVKANGGIGDAIFTQQNLSRP